MLKRGGIKTIKVKDLSQALSGLNQLCSSLWTSRSWFFIFWLIRSLF